MTKKYQIIEVTYSSLYLKISDSSTCSLIRVTGLCDLELTGVAGDVDRGADERPTVGLSFTPIYLR